MKTNILKAIFVLFLVIAFPKFSNAQSACVGSACSAAYMPVASVRAYDFLNTLGAGGGTLAEYQYTGLSHIRMSAGSGGTAIPASVFASYCNAGVHVDLLANWDFNSAGYAGNAQAIANNSLAYLKAIDALAPGCVDTIEGANEPDINTAWGATLAAREAVGDAVSVALYKTIKPLYPNVPIAVWAGGGSFNNRTQHFIRSNITADGDYCNLHDYYGSNRNSGDTWFGGDNPGSLMAFQACQRDVLTNKPVITTETGWAINPASSATNYVNADTQAKYDMNKILDHAELGMPSTYIYDMQTTNLSNDYGLYDINGNARESAIVLHNLTSILKDSGSTAKTFTPIIFPENLAYLFNGLATLTSNNLATGHAYLIQKSDGSLWVLLWNEADTWNYVTHAENTVSPATVTINLPFAFSATVYDPFGCAETQSTCTPTNGVTPVSISINVKQVAVKLTDHLIIIELKVK